MRVGVLVGPGGVFGWGWGSVGMGVLVGVLGEGSRCLFCYGCLSGWDLSETSPAVPQPGTNRSAKHNTMVANTMPKRVVEEFSIAMILLSG